MIEHPLSKDIIARHDYLRAAYHLGDKERLDQAIAWLKDNLQRYRYLTLSGYSGYEIVVDEVVYDLKEAMSPQQQQRID